MYVQFKYQIGDVVTHKTMAPPYLKPTAKFGNAKPQLMLILGRVMDECPGGIQLHYRVRITGEGRLGEIGIVDKLWQLHEEELVPWKEAENDPSASQR